MQSTWVAKAAAPLFSFIFICFQIAPNRERRGNKADQNLSSQSWPAAFNAVILLHRHFCLCFSRVCHSKALCRPSPHLSICLHTSQAPASPSPPPFSGVLVLFVVLLGGHWARGCEAAFLAVLFQCGVGGWVPYTIPIAHAKQFLKTKNLESGGAESSTCSVCR